jgi:hypothetical protein
MRHGYWSTFVTFLVSVTVLGFGIACLVLAEKTDGFGWKTTRKARHLRILGWIAIGSGIPLLMDFFGELLKNLRFAD